MEELHQMWLCAKALWPVWLLAATVTFGAWLDSLGQPGDPAPHTAQNQTHQSHQSHGAHQGDQWAA